LEGKPKCKCPLCDQIFTPENGLSPDEHLANGIILAYKKMQESDFCIYQNCARCGEKRLNAELKTNDLSRHADIIICPECGTDEALREEEENKLPLAEWFIVREIIKKIV